MKYFVATSLLALTAALPLSASAQFSLPSVPGLNKLTGGGASGGDLSGQQDALIRSFVAANKDVLTANARMADALGLKDEAAKAQATADSLTDGATKDNLSDANKAVSDTGGAVAQAMAQKPTLDAAAKAKFTSGLGSLVQGTMKYGTVGKNVKSMGSSLSSASPTMLPKLQSAVYVVGNFPTSATELSKALQNAVSFAQDSGIEVPANSGDALGALGNL